MSDHQEPTLQDQTQQQSNLQTKLSKKEHSYTYWVGEKNKSRVLPPQQQPQKIDPPKLLIQKHQDGRSNWNTVGTWEHRKVSLSEIEKIYSEKLNIWISQNCPDAKLKKVSLKGECEAIFTRNKKAVTYEINGKVEFQKKLTEDKEEITEEKPQEKNESDTSSMSEESSNFENTPSDRSSENQAEKKSSTSKPKITKAKPQTMTLEIGDLTDHGDREFKTKADNADDKKFISQNSESLLCLLEEVLKSFK